MSRKNVWVIRNKNGNYVLMGKSGDHVVSIGPDDWRALGLRPLRKGQEAMIDLQVSGLPKAKKRK